MNQTKAINLLSHTDWPQITELLDAENLPFEDIETAPVQFFGIKNSSELLATGALEVYGNKAILRSVAVKKEFQGKGLGKQITRFLEKKAREQGIDQLFLLTTTAPDYFRKLNYQPFERKACPFEIQQSAEFKNLCPSTAVCLSKDL